MSIDGINFSLKGLGPIQPKSTVEPTQTTEKAGSKTSFGQMFSDAIKEVDKMQTDADKQIEGMVLGKEGVTTHGAMIALEKADIAFQLMTSIRSKIIRAYEEVIRTQV
jgi:flagellar hook-basal body complex protein FliE